MPELHTYSVVGSGRIPLGRTKGTEMLPTVFYVEAVGHVVLY